VHEIVLKSLRSAADKQPGESRLDPETGLTFVACANKFESIGDIASHIAETVVFVVQGRRIRHGASDVSGTTAALQLGSEKDGN
jgi:phosphate uptake regulator